MSLEAQNLLGTAVATGDTTTASPIFDPRADAGKGKREREKKENEERRVSEGRGGRGFFASKSFVEPTPCPVKFGPASE